MTMTVGAVRNVSFGESAQDLINAEGKYTAQAPLEEMPSDSFEKKSNKGAIAAGTAVVGLLALAGGLAYAAKHGKLNDWHVEDLSAVKDNKIMAHIKEYTYQAAEKCKKGYDWIASKFSSKAENATQKTEEIVDEAAKKTEEIGEGAAEKV